MAQASGYAVLPVMPSMSGFGAALQKQVVGPATKAGKEAGNALGKPLMTAVDMADKALKGANYRVKKATEEQQDAESKLAEKKLKVEAANKAVESAARKREEAESKGIDAIERAEETLLRKRAAAEKAARELSSAESTVEDALTESAKAAKNLEQKQEELSKAQKESNQEAEKSKGIFGKLRAVFKEAAGGADGAGDAFGRMDGKVRELNNTTSGFRLGAVAGVFSSVTSSITGSLGDLAKEAFTASDATDKFKSTMDFAGVDSSTIDEMTKKTQKYADDTVYDLADIQNMTAQLASNGVDNYEALGEAAGNLNAVAGGNAETFKSVGMVMTQTAGAGKLTTENWNQLSDAIPGASGKIQEALEKNGAYTGNFRDAMADGQITADEFNQAVMEIGTQPVAVEAAKSTSTFEGMLGNLKATITGGLSNALNELKPQIGASVDGLSDLAGRVMPLVVDSFKNAAEWMSQNKELLTVIAGAAAGVATGLLAVKAVQTGMWAVSAISMFAKTLVAMPALLNAQRLGTLQATAAQMGLNGALVANPIGAVVIAVMAIVGALAIFFTKTETGKKIWKSFTEALAKGWDWVKDKFTAGWEWMRDQVFNPLMSFVTETLWPKIQAAWDGIKQGWDTFVGALQSTWQNVLKPVFDAIWQVVQVTLGVIGAIILTPLLLAWNAFSAGIQWAWQTLIQPAWQALSDFAVNTLWPVLQSIFQWIGDKWNWVKDTFTAGWNWVRDIVFQPLMDFAMNVLWPVIQFVIDQIVNYWNFWRDTFTAGWNWVRDNVFQPLVNFATQVLWPNIMNVVQWIVDKWNWLRDMLGAAWGWIRDNVIQLFINGANNLWNMVSQAIGWIVDKWNWMRDRLFDGWSWIDNNVFSPLKNGLDVVKGWFQTTVDNIGAAWDTIKEKTKAPIAFVVNTVYNKGIKPAWNAVAGFVGMDDKKLPDIAFASGGVLPGYSPGRDDYRFVDPKSGYSIALGGGESIMRPEWTKAVGGKKAVDAMNRSARVGGVNGVRKQLGEGAAYANGGTIDENIARTMAALRPEHGKPYQYGGVGNPSWDCSGLWSGIVQSLNGGNLRGGRIFNTESNFANFGFEPGLSGRVTIGVMNGGGGMNSHMAGTIDGVNLESGGSNGVQIGGAAIGSDNASLPNRYTLTKFLGKFVSGGNGGGGGNPIAALAKAAWDKVMDALPATPSFPGAIGEWPGKAKDMFVDSMWNWVQSKLPIGGGGGGTGGTEQWRGLVEKVLQAKGFDKGMADTVLRRMNQESGGDPSAVNNWDSNATAGTPSKGLMQVIDPTFQSYKDPGYDDIWDPESNIRASMNYAVSRYGSLPAAYDRAGGYHNGGLAGFGQGLMKKTALEPEMVLDPQMTKAFIQWMGVADDVAKAVQPTAAKSANAYATEQAKSVLDVFGLGSVATKAGSWWDKNGEQVTADALSLYGATQNPDSVATVSAFGQSATFEFNAESLDDVVRVGDLTAALEQVGVRTNVRKKATAVLTRGGAL